MSTAYDRRCKIIYTAGPPKTRKPGEPQLRCAVCDAAFGEGQAVYWNDQKKLCHSECPPPIERQTVRCESLDQFASEAAKAIADVDSQHHSHGPCGHCGKDVTERLPLWVVNLNIFANHNHRPGAMPLHHECKAAVEDLYAKRKATFDGLAAMANERLAARPEADDTIAGVPYVVDASEHHGNRREML